jgi:hypothetical protein
MTATVRRSFFAIVFFLAGLFAGATVTLPSFAQGQPHMQTALGYLNQALGQLEAAIPDKAGHRERAAGMTRRAINQTQAGIAAGAR